MNLLTPQDIANYINEGIRHALEGNMHQVEIRFMGPQSLERKIRIVFLPEVGTLDMPSPKTKPKLEVV